MSHRYYDKQVVILFFPDGRTPLDGVARDDWECTYLLSTFLCDRGIACMVSGPEILVANDDAWVYEWTLATEKRLRKIKDKQKLREAFEALPLCDFASLQTRMN